MRILLTGAAGFVGSHLRDRLAAAGHEVVGTTRSAATAAAEGLLVLGDADPPADFLRDFDALIHTAGATPANAGADPGAWGDSLALSRRLAGAVSESAVRTVIHLSSVAALGGPQALSRGAVDDSWPSVPSSDYGRSKAETEAIFAALAGPDRLVVSLRLPLIYGARARGSWAQLLSLVRSPLPLPFASVRNRRSFLGIDNLGSLVEAILARRGEGGCSGSYLAADREIVSLRGICASLRRSLGRGPGLFPFPPGLMAGVLRRAGRAEAAAGLFDDLVIDASRAESVFSWVPALATPEGMVRALTHPPSSPHP